MIVPSMFLYIIATGGLAKGLTFLYVALSIVWAAFEITDIGE